MSAVSLTSEQHRVSHLHPEPHVCGVFLFAQVRPSFSFPYAHQQPEGVDKSLVARHKALALPASSRSLVAFRAIAGKHFECELIKARIWTGLRTALFHLKLVRSSVVQRSLL